ncbi:MAG: host attachment protein [Steroidobacteraceae bacterium]
MKTCILVADSGTARLLRVDGAARKRVLVEMARLECPPARRLPQELVSDRTGRVRARRRRYARARLAPACGS